jgi:heme exporter protein A
MNADGPFREGSCLRAEGLAVARGGRLLFESLDFTAEPGAFVEIRGANGAGKTSLLRALAGFLKPRAGRIVFDNIEEPALALHFLGHRNGLKPSTSVRAHLRYWAGLFASAPSDEALARVGLARCADLPARVLSQGQARRLALARLLIAPRPIWLLDEPAAALDHDGRALLVDLINAHRARGGIVLAALHEPLDAAASLSLNLSALS